MVDGGSIPPTLLKLTFKKIEIMTKSYTLMKISWELFNKCYTKLTLEQKTQVYNIYLDFY